MAGTSKTNGVTKKNGHVSLAREEYDALMAREERFVEVVTDNAKFATRVSELASTCDDQVQRMLLIDAKTQHLDRVNNLQHMFIEMLRADHPAVAALEDLSEFWRLWQLHTRKAIDERKTTEAEVAKLEPDIFRTWRNWVRDAGKTDRVFGESGSVMTRADRERSTPGEMQEHIIRRLNEDNAKLVADKAKLEAQIAEYTKFNPGKGSNP